MGVYTFFNYELDSIRSNDVITMICSYADNTLTKYYLSTLTLIQFVIPFIVFTYTYLIVWYEFRFGKSNEKLGNNLSINRIEKSKENRNKVLIWYYFSHLFVLNINYDSVYKALKMILAFYIVFLFCWTPIESYSAIQIFYCEINA